MKNTIKTTLHESTKSTKTLYWNAQTKKAVVVRFNKEDKEYSANCFVNVDNNNLLTWNANSDMCQHRVLNMSKTYKRLTQIKQAAKEFGVTI